MNKTVQALDELVSSIITLVPTWLSMLKSTRVLTILGTGAIMYFTATQGGLKENQAMLMQIVEAALGVSFIGFKTLRSSGGNGNHLVSPPPISIVNQPTEQPEILEELIPFNKEEFMAKVNERAKSWGVINDCTTYYASRDILKTSGFNNRQAWSDAWAFIKILAGNAFKEVWKVSYDDALLSIYKVDEKGCTYPSLEYAAIQKGMAFHAILLEYKEVQESA